MQQSNVANREEYWVWSTNIIDQELKTQLKEKVSEFEEVARCSFIKRHIKKMKPIADMPEDNKVVINVKADNSSIKKYIQKLIGLEIQKRFLLDT